MKAFLSVIFIQNTVAEYEIFNFGKKYKARLILNDSSAHLPLQLSFTKENGRWKSTHLLDEHVLYQFGYNIDNHLLSVAIAQLRNCAA